MEKCIDSIAINNRLKRIEGQVRGLMKMVDDDKNCEDIIVQISSVKSALHKTGQAILEGHIKFCVLQGIREGNVEETLKKLTAVVEQFSRII